MFLLSELIAQIVILRGAFSERSAHSPAGAFRRIIFIWI
jgi:hypothetical protein